MDSIYGRKCSFLADGKFNPYKSPLCPYAEQVHLLARDALGMAGIFHDTDDWLDVGHGQRTISGRFVQPASFFYDKRTSFIMAYH